MADPRTRPAVARAVVAVALAVAALLVPAAAAIAAGPPFPEPQDGVRVYDTAGVFRPDTVHRVAETIRQIELRTGAQVVVYTQPVEDGRTTDEADADARALMDQWGVGRKGFDDGLVILFDMYPGRQHGQVQLYAGPGFAALSRNVARKPGPPYRIT